MRVRAEIALAALATAGCALAAPNPPPSPRALFSALGRFADARMMTPAEVERALGARVRSESDGTALFSTTMVGGYRMDSIELSTASGAADLDLFPGADCLERATAERALGSSPAVSALPSETGRKLSWRLPAISSRAWPSEVYRLEITFAGAGRCATQINIHHQR